MDVVRDGYYAIRRLRAKKLLTLTAILSLALGIGANAAIFSTIDALVLRELPVHEPERLVFLAIGDDATPPNAFTYPVWERIRSRQPRLFDGAFAWAPVRLVPARGGEAIPIDGLFASSEIFSVLGVAPLVGRAFTEEDDRRGGGRAGPVAVISFGFWQRRFGGAKDAVGQSIDVGGNTPFTIVGVMPPGFFGPQVGRSFDVIVPLATEPVINAPNTMLGQYSGRWLSIMARLHPAQTLKAAGDAVRRAQQDVRAETLAGVRAEDASSYLTESFTVRPGARGYSALRRQYDRPLTILFLVAIFVLLIACGNVANLLLIDAAKRSSDIAIRAALGASRWRITRELLFEGALISLAGATMGLMFALWISQLLVRQMSTPANAVWLDVGLDVRIAAFAAVLAIATTMICVIAPARRASRLDSTEMLKGRTPGSTSRTGGALIASLVVVQAALAFVLVTTAGLLLRTYVSLATLAPGFDAANVLVATIVAPPDRMMNRDKLLLIEQLRNTVAAVPGVSSVAVSVIAPVSGVSSQASVELSNLQLSENQRLVHINAVTPLWFATYGTPLLAGRDFSAFDRIDTPRVAIVNQAFVRKFMSGVEPTGATMASLSGPGRSRESFEIIGIAADAVYTSLRDPVPPTIYFALTQRRTAPNLVTASMGIRTIGPPSAVAASVGAVIAGIDGNLQFRFRPLSDQLSALYAQERVVAMVAVFFGGLALLLAALGIYGVTAQTVADLRTDIGIRLALGATASRVIRSVVLRFTRLVFAGTVIGVIFSAWSAKFASALLFGVQAWDTPTFTAAMVILLGVGLLGAWIPARHIVGMAPGAVLRSE